MPDHHQWRRCCYIVLSLDSWGLCIELEQKSSPLIGTWKWIWTWYLHAIVCSEFQWQENLWLRTWLVTHCWVKARNSAGNEITHFHGPVRIVALYHIDMVLLWLLGLRVLSLKWKMWNSRWIYLPCKDFPVLECHNSRSEIGIYVTLLYSLPFRPLRTYVQDHKAITYCSITTC